MYVLHKRISQKNRKEKEKEKGKIKGKIKRILKKIWDPERRILENSKHSYPHMRDQNKRGHMK